MKFSTETSLTKKIFKYKWIADYCIYPLGKTLGELIPSGAEKKDFIWITPLPMPAMRADAIAKEMLEILKQHPDGLSLNDLVRQSGLKSAASIVRGMRMAVIAFSAKTKNGSAVRMQKSSASTKIPLITPGSRPVSRRSSIALKAKVRLSFGS